MKKFTTAGLITSGVVGAVGLAYAMSDKKMRNKVANNSKKMLNKASGAMSKIDL